MAALSNTMLPPKITIVGVHDPMPGREILSPYSQKVCSLIAQGYTSQEIAAQLGSKSAAIDVMVSRAMQKVGVRTRSGLAVWYISSTFFQQGN